MCSVNQVFVLPKVMADRGPSLAEGLVESITLGVGQFCTSPALLRTDALTLLDNSEIAGEVFGPAAIVVVCDSIDELLVVAESLAGQLTASVHGTTEDLQGFRKLFGILQRKAGRLIVNGFPTGVEGCPAMHHGGPYPATTDSRSTSVGTDAVHRFLRPVAYQGFPLELLPEPLRDLNRRKIWRMVDGEMSCDDL